MTIAVFSAVGFIKSGLQADLASHMIGPGPESGSNLTGYIDGAFSRYFASLGFALVAGLCLFRFDGGLHEQRRSVVASTALVISFSLAWIALTRVLQFPICGDDSYIDFRYIRNWVNGISFDYNPGEKVIGFTSHIHLILLYFLCSVFRATDVALVSQMTNAVFQIVNAVIIYFFAFDLFSKRSAAAAALFVYALDPYGIQQTIFGKETHILVTFLVLSIWAMHHKKQTAVAWLTSIMPFIRPEAAIWWMVALVWSFRQNRKNLVGAYLFPGLCVLAILLALYLAFGTVIPHGMVGKFKMFYPMPPAFMFLNTVWMIGTGIFLPRFYLDVPGIAYFLAATITGLFTIIVSFKIFKLPALRYYMAAVIVYMVVFGIKNPAPFGWYHCWYSLIPVFFAALVFPWCLENITDSKRSVWKRIVALLSISALLLVQLVQQFTRPEANLTAVTFAWNNEFKRLAQFGEALEVIKKYPGGDKATIGAPEIGYLGYKHSGRILDFCGLLSPEVVRFGRLPDSHQGKGEVLEINPAIVEALKPEYIITLEAFGRELLKDPYFIGHYEKIATFENTWADSKGLFLYRLKQESGDETGLESIEDKSSE